MDNSNSKNLASRIAIQSILVPSIRIIDDQGDKIEFNTMLACTNTAYKNKADLIELMYYFKQEGIEEPFEYGYINPVWVEMVASNEWNDIMHQLFWTLWDGNPDSMSYAVNDTYNSYYPLP